MAEKVWERGVRWWPLSNGAGSARSLVCVTGAESLSLGESAMHLAQHQYPVPSSPCEVQALSLGPNNLLGTTDWLQIGKGVHEGHPAYLTYAEYIMRNEGLEEAHAGIKIAVRNINNLRYADDTTLMVESEEELRAS